MAGDVRFGIIPAYAGSTGARGTRRYRRSGSSPHTRGAPQEEVHGQGGYGDHPRIRGEHSAPELRTPSATGSSPHTRGAQHGRIPPRRGRGIIPAYAGSTCTRGAGDGSAFGSSPHTRGAPERMYTTPERSRDHPRIRGEHTRYVDVETTTPGMIPAYEGSPAPFVALLCL